MSAWIYRGDLRALLYVASVCMHTDSIPFPLSLPLSLQFVYCGKKANLVVGNVKPLGSMPEGTIICNVEEVRQRQQREEWAGARIAASASVSVAAARTHPLFPFQLTRTESR